MKMNKVIAMMLCAALLACLMAPIVASAEMGIMPFASSLIKSTSIGMGKDGKTVIASSKISANLPVAQLGVSSIKLQEYQSGSWVTVKSAASSYSYNDMAHIKSLTYAGTSGKQYRCVAVFYIKNGGTSETRNFTSSTITL